MDFVSQSVEDYFPIASREKPDNTTGIMDDKFVERGGGFDDGEVCFFVVCRYLA